MCIQDNSCRAVLVRVHSRIMVFLHSCVRWSLTSSPHITYYTYVLCQIHKQYSWFPYSRTCIDLLIFQEPLINTKDSILHQHFLLVKFNLHLFSFKYQFHFFDDSYSFLTSIFSFKDQFQYWDHPYRFLVSAKHVISIEPKLPTPYLP